MELMASAKLGAAGFVNAASIDPEVLAGIFTGLISAEANLVIASLALPNTFQKILEGDFIAIRSPSVRKHGILRNIIANELGQAKGIVALEPEKTHCCA